jgi:hypothetical protein
MNARRFAPTLLALFAALASLVALSSLLAACDQSGTEVASSDAAASDGVAPEAAPPEGSTADAGSDVKDGGGDTATGPGDAATFGFIEFNQLQGAGGQFIAAFYETTALPQSACTTTASDAGSCLVTTCPSQGATDAGAVSLVSAGTLTVTGGAFGDAGVKLGTNNLGSYLYNTTGPMFAPGDTLTVSAAGGTVPAFPAQALVAPGTITLTAPLPSDAGDAGAIVIPTAQPLDVTWTGGQTGARVNVTLSAFFTSGASASTFCSWDATTGQGTVPASALAPLASGTLQAGGVVSYQQAPTSFDAGPWTVALRAYTNNASPATFQ